MDTELAQDGLFDPLRGQTPVTSSNPPPPAYHYATNTGPIARNYLTQPPVIPHKIDGYDINMRSNKCLSCHSWRSYREWGATKISLTHYRDRDGRELDDVSPLRYFCTQCHVPQLDARPLVRNDFRPVASLDAR
ncbi:MAG: nitrate reductase cytochrome c-type subunit [Gammaproteobacteria bacterium]|nr:nitrate reductase cytochrome c-type subunit [Gammaproteobacteria bacterium]